MLWRHSFVIDHKANSFLCWILELLAQPMLKLICLLLTGHVCVQVLVIGYASKGMVLP